MRRTKTRKVVKLCSLTNQVTPFDQSMSSSTSHFLLIPFFIPPENVPQTKLEACVQNWSYFANPKTFHSPRETDSIFISNLSLTSEQARARPVWPSGWRGSSPSPQPIQRSSACCTQPLRTWLTELDRIGLVSRNNWVKDIQRDGSLNTRMTSQNISQLVNWRLKTGK